MEYPLSKRLAAECLGTCCFVFAGTGAIVVNDVSGGAVSHVGIALTFGLVVFVMIAAVGDVSGAHLNPAVTLGFFLARRLGGRVVLPYMASQCAGAMLGSVGLRLLFPNHPTLGTTSPGGPVYQSFALETLLTTALMFVILNATTGAKEQGIPVALAVGGVIALAALFAGPVCGASMNPARSLAPAMVSLHLEHVWVYLVAPTLGAALAVPTCRCVRERSCCRAVGAGEGAG